MAGMETQLHAIINKEGVYKAFPPITVGLVFLACGSNFMD